MACFGMGNILFRLKITKSNIVPKYKGLSPYYTTSQSLSIVYVHLGTAPQELDVANLCIKCDLYFDLDLVPSHERKHLVLS